MSLTLGMILIAVVTAISSSIIGLFLVLRKMSMLTDAISHTVLFGVVVGFLIVGDIQSPLVVMFAGLAGLLTSWLVEILVKSKKTSEDAATGVVFPLLFSLAIIIINAPGSFMKNAHIDNDAVFLGHIELAAIDWFSIGSLFIPTNLLLVLGVLIINIIFITVFFKELKIVSFDQALATVLGISPVIIHYLLMTLISVTAVTAFNMVGAVMVVSLMVGPGATALLISKDLKKTIFITALVATINVLIGYFLGDIWTVPMSGMISVVTLAVFLLVLAFNPKNGMISTVIKRNKLKTIYKVIVMLVHIENHEGEEDERLENALDTIVPMLNWTQSDFDKIFNIAIKNQYVYLDDNIIRLTETGKEFKYQYLWKYLL